MKKPKIKARINLEELAGGALAEKFNEAFAQVAENIQNPNTDAATKRQITITIKFAPNKNRQIVGTQIAVTTKLAQTEAIDTQMVMGTNMRTGEIEISEYDGQIRGQMDFRSFLRAKYPEEAAEADERRREAARRQEEFQAEEPAEEAAPTGKPLDLKKRGRQETAGGLEPGRDYDPETGEVLGKGTDLAEENRTDRRQGAEKRVRVVSTEKKAVQA